MIFAKPEIKGMKHVGFALLRIHVPRGFECQPGTEGACPIADQNRCVMQIAAIARFHRETGVDAFAGVN